MKQYATLEATVYFWFAANNTSGSGGDGATPLADVRLAGAAADAAPVLSPTPVLLSHVNYPAGCYEVAVAATTGNGFAADNTYAVFCTLTIDSQNPTGFIGSFDLKPIESNPKQLGDSTQSLSDLKDFVDAGYNPGTHKVEGVKLVDAATATAFDLILKDSTFALAIADAIWDEILTGTTHNIATSAGRRLREIAAYAIHSGTAQAGTATSITLAAAANGGNGIFNRNLVVLVGGTGVGQTRTIADYNDTTKVCVIDREWRINPDNTSVYQILADDTPLVVDHGIAQGGTASTITLRDYASSTDDIYSCNIIIIIGGTGRGQARLVGSYNGTTKVVTVCGDDWKTIPDTTSVYVMIPYGTTCTSCVGDYALGQINDIDNLAFLQDIEGGRWKIDAAAKQMVFYKSDNVTEVARFDLFDQDGVPASVDVFERVRV